MFTACSSHWDSYSSSTRSKYSKVKNANGKSGRRKAVKKSSGYSNKGYYAKKGGTFHDSYSKKTKRKHRKKYEHNGKQHKRRGRLFKPKRKMVKRKGQGR
jgi:hypothetical protein